MRIEVAPETLTDAARTLWTAAAQASQARGHLTAAGHGVSDGAGTPDAGAAFDSMVSAWSGALGRIADNLTAYERNTEVAAELYQHADATAMPSAPPPPPPPPKHHDPGFPLFGPRPEDLLA